MSSDRSPCLFCGMSGSKRTAEHVLRKAWRDEFRVSSNRTFWSATASHETVQRRPITQFDMVVNAICARCNNGWLNALDADAEPVLKFLIRAEGAAPHGAAMNDLAYWAACRGLIRTHACPSGKAPRELFEQAYTNRLARRVPAGWAVAIAPTAHVDFEAGTHQSLRVEGEYLAHVALPLDSLLIHVFIAEGRTAAALTTRALKHLRAWFPESYWPLPVPSPTAVPRPPIALSLPEARIASSCLGFFFGMPTSDHLGRPLDAQGIIDPSRLGQIPWQFT